jgi:DNA-binding Xre family transcriptional regulator
VINRLKEFLDSRGVTSGYQFWKDTGLPQSTAFRLYSDRSVYPSKKVMDIICRTYNAKPGDLLDWIPDNGEAA